MKIALTGHRPQRLRGKEAEIKEWIKQELKKNNATEAYSGMAQGADQTFALSAIELNVPLVCCFPYRRNKFHIVEEAIMLDADSIRFISDEYSRNCYWIRDKYLVDNCDILFAVWDGIEKGGTWLTINYARKMGKKIIYCPCLTAEDSHEN